MQKVQFNKGASNSSTDTAASHYTPSKIVCIGRNYVEHIEELNNTMPDTMVVFNKPNSAISQTLQSFHHEALHYEAEICFLIINKQLAAVGFGLDLTKRALQSKLKEKGLPWERAKAFDGAALFSPFVPLPNHDWKGLAVELCINDEQAQFGQVEQMLYKPNTILKEISGYTHLCDGDIIMTGTPKGVNSIKQGDVFTGKIFQNGKCLIEASWQAS